MFSPRIRSDAVGEIRLIFNGNHYDCFAKPNLVPDNTQHTLASSTGTPNEIPDATGYRLTRPKPYHTKQHHVKNINVVTWNVRGAATPLKKSEIDAVLETKAVYIACLQETHLKDRTYDSKHFHWSLSRNNMRRGLAILIKKKCRLGNKVDKVQHEQHGGIDNDRYYNHPIHHHQPRI